MKTGTGSKRLKLKLREWMSIRELTLMDVAKAVGKSQRTIQNWVDGKTLPNLSEADKLASLFDCEIRELFSH